MYEGSQLLLQRLEPTRDYVRHQLELTLAQMAQQRAAVAAVTGAILILVLGHLLLRIAARIAERVAVSRWRSDPTEHGTPSASR
ncbi:MAG TPA: hypothetical protein VF859_01675, partial [Burkholderiales bacterium]